MEGVGKAEEHTCQGRRRTGYDALDVLPREAESLVPSRPALERLGEPGAHPRHHALLDWVELGEVEVGVCDEEGDGETDFLRHLAQRRVRALQTPQDLFPFWEGGETGPPRPTVQSSWVRPPRFASSRIPKARLRRASLACRDRVPMACDRRDNEIRHS